MGSLPQAAEESLIRAVCQIVEKRTGTQLGPKQFNMVQGRLRRRLTELHLDNYEQYQAYLQRNPKECDVLVSLLTTHHTYFFREFVHFEHVESTLPDLVRRARERGAPRLEVLSAACSAGQEVYSLAMHLQKHLPDHAPELGYRVFGSDVDGESVKLAANGVYRFEEIKTVPLKYLDDHWARGRGEIADFVKVRNSLRENCEFSILNLLDLRSLDNRKFDLIFCRNIFIYFSQKQIKSVAESLIRHLHPGGQLILGLSETLNGMDIPLKAVGPSIYARSEDVVPQRSVVSAPVAVAPLPTLLRVVCIDDSTSILGLLQHILGREDGFEVVGTAANGEEGARLVAKLKPDLITLDLHMPVCDGLTFLERRSNAGIPVVVVSSVSRDDAGLALRALKLGAADYVEKPALQNLERRADELRSKLRTAIKPRKKEIFLTSVDEQFARPMVLANRERCLRVVLFSLSDQERCARVVRESRVHGVPLVLSIEGAENVLPEVCERIALETGQAIRVAHQAPKPGEAVAGEWHSFAKEIPSLGFERISILVLGEISAHGARDLLAIPGAQIVVEDGCSGAGIKLLHAKTADIVPATSFGYVSDSFLAYGKREAA